MKMNNWFTRILAALLAALLCLSLVIPVLAADDSDTIYIYDAEDLLELAEYCRLDTWSQGKTVILKADISLDGMDYQPIPSFGGTFDGEGHTISGLSITESIIPAGIFGVLQEKGTVKYLNVSGTIAPSGDADMVGGIAGENYGTIRSCTFTGTVSGKRNVGGIACANAITGVISNCQATGAVSGEKMTGGIAGCNLGTVRWSSNGAYINTVSADRTLSIEDIDLSFMLDLSKLSTLDTSTAASDTGGIAGYSSGIIGNCTNTGTVGYPHVGYNVGGIAGRSCGYLYDCENEGMIYGRKDVGGIAGQLEPYIAENLTESTLAKLQRQLDELDELLNQAMDDAGSGLGTLNSRLNSMANSVGSAAAAAQDIKTYGTVSSTVSGEGETSGDGSVTVTPSQVEVSVGSGAGSGLDVEISDGSASISGGIAAGGGVQAGLTEGGASGEGESSASGTVSASTQITMTTSLGGLSSSLSSLSGQMRLLNGEISGVSGTLQADVQAINEKVNEISDTAFDLFLGDGNEDVLIDSSETDIDLITLGKTKNCVNSGSIDGDINIGGITGAMAMEYELDPEDDVTSSIDSSQRRKYEVQAVIQECKNTGTVTAKHNYTGGIVGKMDVGLIAGAESYGRVESEGGDYVGGIAGITSSTIRYSFAKCSLSGGSYVGGIVGSGVAEDIGGSSSTVAGCASMVEITEYEQYAGAISGVNTGSFLENYFVSDTLAGINGMSYSGKAEPISYKELLNEFPWNLTQILEEQDKSEEETEPADGSAEPSEEETEPEAAKAAVLAAYSLPQEFESFTLSFVADGEELKSLTFDYGDLFDASVYPEIPQKDGYYGHWDIAELKDLHFDTVVTAVYTQYTSALPSSDTRTNGKPVFFTEGQLDDESTITVEAAANTPSQFDCLPDGFFETIGKCFAGKNLYCEIVEQWKLTIPADGMDTHTIRYLPPDGDTDDLSVFVKLDGRWHEVDTEVIGSYLTFQVAGSEIDLAVISTMPIWWVWLIPLVLVGLFVWLIIRLIRKIGRMKPAPQPAAPMDTAQLLQAKEEELERMKAEIDALKSGAVHPATAQTPTRKKKRWLILLIAVLAVLLAAGIAFAIFFLNSGLKDGIQAYQLLKTVTKEDALSMTLEVQADFDGAALDFSARIDRADVDGNCVTRISQDGRSLYYFDNAVFLENGKAYQVSEVYPNYSELLTKAYELYQRVEITAGKDSGRQTYSITAQNEDASGLLEILLPSAADQITGIQIVEVTLIADGSDLEQIQFASQGTFSDKAFSVDAQLQIKPPVDLEIPEVVQTAITDGTYETGAVLSEDLAALLNAWEDLNSRELLTAGLRLSADCGPLVVSEQLELYRSTAYSEPIYSLQKNGYSLYFSGDTVCDRSGRSIPAEQKALADAAQLLDIAYQLCLNMDFACSGGVYTITLDQHGMQAVAEAIAPEIADLEVCFGDGSLEIILKDGAISSICFSISGSAKVVVADVAVSLDGELQILESDEDFTIPEAVLDVLVK